MQRFILVFAAAICCRGAMGQVSTDEAQRRLDERRAARSATSPTTLPAVAAAPAATARPGRTRQIYQAKRGAPLAVHQWISEQPYIRAGILAEKEKAIAEAKAEIEQLQGKTMRTVSLGSGSALSRRDVVDRQAERQWSEQLAVKRKAMAELVRQKKAFEADETPRLYYTPTMSLNKGSIGKLGFWKVMQIVGAKEMIVTRPGNDQMLWLKGWDTTGMVDDQKIDDESITAMITDTKTYTTALGGSRTLFVAEPFDLEGCVELVEVDAAAVPMPTRSVTPPAPRPAQPKRSAAPSSGF